MKISIAVLSGKGGTGKTFVSTNLVRTLEKEDRRVRYLDCDVEEPNGHLFLKPDINREEAVTLAAPAGVDEKKCTACGACVRACRYNALALVNKQVLFFKNLCHVCGACSLVCPEKAVVLGDRKIGVLKNGSSGNIDVCYGLLETGEGGMTPRVIRKVKEQQGDGITILDSPPGTSCPVVETVKHADLCVLVTDPTPFGVNDLKLAVSMCRELGMEPVVIVNRAAYLSSELKDYCHVAHLEIVGEIPDERRIAECYSEGDLAVDRFPEYKRIFSELAQTLLACVHNKKRALHPTQNTAHGVEGNGVPPNNMTCQVFSAEDDKAPAVSVKEVVVISGKGGTGKTSLAACFAALARETAIADCDVDAADLHLLLQPAVREQGMFSGGEKASISAEQCTGCGACLRVCRFEAVCQAGSGSGTTYSIDEKSCEGCAVCGIICPVDAISFHPAVNGEWYVSDTRFGPMSHARLGIAEENSGKLVSLIRKKKNNLAAAGDLAFSIVDGSPGTGCPVIASITGTDYALVVTEPTVSGVHDLKRILDVISFFGLRSGVLVNKHDLNPSKTNEIRDISVQAGADYLGTIPYDKAVTAAQMQAMSVVEYDGETCSAQAIRRVWERVKKRLNGEPDGG